MNRQRTNEARDGYCSYELKQGIIALVQNDNADMDKFHYLIIDLYNVNTHLNCLDGVILKKSYLIEN